MAATVDLIVRIVTDTTKAAQGLDKTASRADKMKSGVKAAGKVAAGALLAVGAAAVKAGNAAAEDAQSQALLSNAMVKNAGASKDQIKATEDWITKMGAATGVADDEMRPALSALVRATGDVEKSQKDMATAMDISAATGKPLQSVTEAIAKGYAGNTTALGRLVPGIDKATLASKDMTKIMGELGDKTEGAAAESADTAAGKMKIMTLQMGEAEETMGTALLPIMAKFATVMATVAIWIQKNSTLFQVIVGIVAAFAAAIIILNAAISIYTAVTTLAAAATEHAWIAALGPIGLVILAVVAAIAIVVVLWKKCETFRRIVTAAFNAVKNAAEKAFGWVKKNWPLILAILTGPIGLAVLAIAKSWDKIKAGATAVKDWVDAKFDAIKVSATSVKDWIIDKFAAVWTSVRDVFTKISDKFGELKTFIKNLKIPNPLSGLITAFNTVIGLVDDLIDALRDIKVPAIKLPFGIGKAAPAGAPAVGTAGYAAPRVTGTTARAGTVTGSGNTYIINGALDPEAVARQIQRLERGHARRVGLRSA